MNDEIEKIEFESLLPMKAAVVDSLAIKMLVID